MGIKLHNLSTCELFPVISPTIKQINATARVTVDTWIRASHSNVVKLRSAVKMATEIKTKVMIKKEAVLIINGN